MTKNRALGISGRLGRAAGLLAGVTRSQRIDGRPRGPFVPVPAVIGGLGEAAVGSHGALRVGEGPGAEPVPELSRVGQDAEEVDEGDEGEAGGD